MLLTGGIDVRFSKQSGQIPSKGGEDGNSGGKISGDLLRYPLDAGLCEKHLRLIRMLPMTWTARCGYGHQN